MIGSLRGVVVERRLRRDQSGEVVVEVAGVGYRLTVPAAALAEWSGAATEVRLWVHTHVREDAIVLYGFPEQDQRVCFEALIGAHGVGPAVALAMLSVHSPAALRRAVAAEDLDALTLVPGIGPKTAARLLMELQSRLDLDADAGNGLTTPPAGTAADDGLASGGPLRRAEVRAALTTLGYSSEEVRHALARLPDGGSVEDLVRLALHELAGIR